MIAGSRSTAEGNRHAFVIAWFCLEGGTALPGAKIARATKFVVPALGQRYD